MDARSIVLLLADARLLLFYAMGYIGCVGMVFLLSQAGWQKAMLAKKASASPRSPSLSLALAVVLGSVFWYGLLSFPFLLWLPFSLFLVISWGLAA